MKGQLQTHITSNVDIPYSTVAVVGMGYVGLPLAVLAEQKGYAVVGIDIDLPKLDSLVSGEIPFEADGYLKEHFAKTKQLGFTESFQILKGADVIIITVPTPVNDDLTPDLEPLKSAAYSIAPHLEKGQLVVLESTVYPGTTEEVLLPILEQISGLAGGEDFHLAHCPERINPGDSKWNVSNIPRVVGGLEPKSTRRALQFYRSLIDARVTALPSMKEAEASKLVENAFRDVNIAFANELAQFFGKLGLDTRRIIEAAATKPFAFMAHYPSCGVGGHCIPVDPYYLIQHGKENGFSLELISKAREINSSMPGKTVKLLADGLEKKGVPMRKATVAVLGLAYKPNVDDVRESPSFEILRELKSRRVKTRTFDPHVLSLSTSPSLYEALDGADAAVIATAHQEFLYLNSEVFSRFGVGVVVDGQNCLNKAQLLSGEIVYKGIGR